MNAQEYFDRYEFTRAQLTELLRQAGNLQIPADTLMEMLYDEKLAYWNGDACEDASQCLPPRHWDAREWTMGRSLPEGMPDNPKLAMMLLQPDGTRHVRLHDVELRAFLGGPLLAVAKLVIDWGDAQYAWTDGDEWKPLYEDGRLLSVHEIVERWAQAWRKE